MAGSSLVAGILPNRGHEPFTVLFELAFPHTVDGKELVVSDRLDPYHVTQRLVGEHDVRRFAEFARDVQSQRTQLLE